MVPGVLYSSPPAGRQCKAPRADGGECRAWALAGSEYCLAHDPARAAEVAEGRRKGGRARHGRQLGEQAPRGRVTIEGPGDALKVLEGEINCVGTLEISNSRGLTIARLISVYLAGWESSELERRIAALEERMQSGKS